MSDLWLSLGVLAERIVNQSKDLSPLPSRPHCLDIETDQLQRIAEPISAPIFDENDHAP